MAGPVRNRDGGDAIDRRVLAAGVRDSDGAGLPGVSGECRPHQKSAGTKIGCTGMPKSASATIQRMQKVLTEMNVQIANGSSDISGVTGMAILDAILEGERDRYKLADPGSQPEAPKQGKRPGGNAPRFDLRSELYRISGIDLTRIDGINVMNAQSIIAEVGLDMSRWPTEAHFASWLGLCPDNKITGGKVYDRASRHVENRAATAFRMAATSLWRSKSYLGAKFKRLRTQLGAPKAITAMAHNLARLLYRMLKYRQEYVDKGMEFYQQRNWG